jgi:hypothetical protein
MTPLTQHFFLEEFLSSETAARMGQEIIPTVAETENIILLCKTLLEPIRAKLGRPMVITSGLRPLWLNLQIGGSTNSAHLHGLAADIKVVGMSPATFARWVQQNFEPEEWPVDQCILEFNSWVHLSTAKPPRHQFLTAKKDHDKTIYSTGISV